MPFPKKDPSAPPKPPKRARLSKKGHMANRRSLGTFTHVGDDGVTYLMSIQAPDPPRSPNKSRRTYDRFLQKVQAAIAKPKGTASLGSGLVIHAQPLPPEPAGV